MIPRCAYPRSLIDTAFADRDRLVVDLVDEQLPAGDPLRQVRADETGRTTCRRHRERSSTFVIGIIGRSDLVEHRSVRLGLVGMEQCNRGWIAPHRQERRECAGVGRRHDERMQRARSSQLEEHCGAEVLEARPHEEAVEFAVGVDGGSPDQLILPHERDRVSLVAECRPHVVGWSGERRAILGSEIVGGLTSDVADHGVQVLCSGC